MWFINLILAGLRAWEEAERKAREQAAAQLPPQARAQVEAQIARSAQVRADLSPRLAQAAQKLQNAVPTTPRQTKDFLPTVHANTFQRGHVHPQVRQIAIIDDAPAGLSEWVIRLFEGRRD
jgi:hypothetical protein